MENKVILGIMMNGYYKIMLMIKYTTILMWRTLNKWELLLSCKTMIFQIISILFYVFCL